MSSQEEQLVSIHVLSNRFEADMLMGALEAESIPAVMKSHEETAYSGLFVSQKGWGAILVPEEHAEQAREVIKPLLKQVEANQLYLDPSQVDSTLWQRLRDADPERICENALVDYDSQAQGYRVPFLNAEFICLADEERIEPVPSVSPHKVDFQFVLAMLHYLLESRPVEASGKWISEKDIPGGETFFRGYHALPMDRLVKAFGNHTDVFRSTMEQFGGTAVEMGDMAYRIDAFPRAPLLFVFWRGDEEFDPAVNLLFDSTINNHFRNLDALLAMVYSVCGSIRAAARNILQNPK